MCHLGPGLYDSNCKYLVYLLTFAVQTSKGCLFFKKNKNTLSGSFLHIPDRPAIIDLTVQDHSALW